MKNYEGVPSVVKTNAHVCEGQSNVSQLNIEEVIAQYDCVIKKVATNFKEIYPQISEEDLYQESVLAIIELLEQTDSNIRSERLSALITNVIKRCMRIYCDRDYVASKRVLIEQEDYTEDSVADSIDIRNWLASISKYHRYIVMKVCIDDDTFTSVSRDIGVSAAIISRDFYYALRLMRRHRGYMNAYMDCM